MVFGQAPCSAGRAKRRNVAYLGLLPAPQAGRSDITNLYIARYDESGVGPEGLYRHPSAEGRLGGV
jgi:hypothetical protein